MRVILFLRIGLLIYLALKNETKKYKNWLSDLYV